MPVTLDDIRAAQGLLEGVVVKTPLVPAPRLSERLGADILLKLENLQYTGSFKDRGAFVKLHGLSEAARRAGVIAASAGNHAQGVAYHARNLGIRATIVMPESTPFTKVEETRRLGAEIVLHGARLGESTDFAMETAAREGSTFVHPYDDPAVIAGQGTIALEILTAAPDVDALIIPIGGGGLIAGNSIAAKALKPAVAIFGVEAAAVPSMYEALRGLPPTASGSTLAEGIAVQRPGRLTEPVVREMVDDVLLAGEDEIERAVEALLLEEKVLAEGAGAAPLAALEANGERFSGQTVALIISGGNIDARMVSSVLLRGLVRDGRIIRLRVEIVDQPGALNKVSGIVAETGGNIIEVYHQRLFSDVPVKFAELDLMIETRNAEHGREIMRKMTEAGFSNRLLSSRAAGNEG
jgi:threonine dehydratase